MLSLTESFTKVEYIPSFLLYYWWSGSNGEPSALTPKVTNLISQLLHQKVSQWPCRSLCLHRLESGSPQLPQGGTRSSFSPLSITTFLLRVTGHQKKPLVPKSNSLMETENGISKQSPGASLGSERTAVWGQDQEPAEPEKAPGSGSTCTLKPVLECSYGEGMVILCVYRYFQMTVLSITKTWGDYVK